MRLETDGDTKNAQSMSQNVACYPRKIAGGTALFGLKAFRKKKWLHQAEVLGEGFRQTTPVELGQFRFNFRFVINSREAENESKIAKKWFKLQILEFIGGSGS